MGPVESPQCDARTDNPRPLVCPRAAGHDGPHFLADADFVNEVLPYGGALDVLPETAE